MYVANKYQRWLRSLVDRPGSSYDVLFDVAWATFYEFFIPNDDNRAMDGLGLRENFEFISSVRLPYLGPCRMLEFLIALAQRINETSYDYTNPDKTDYWFWVLIENLNILEFDDARQREALIEITEAFERVNDRTYDPSGRGGLFPLEYPTEDQRDVEVWYQMMAYLKEGNRVTKL